MSEDRDPRRALYEELSRLSEHLSPDADPEPSDIATRYADVLENLRAIMFEVDPNGQIVHASSTATDVLGYAPSELVTATLEDWIHPGDFEAITLNARRARETGKRSRLAFRARHKCGEWRWLEAAPAIPYRKPDGRVHTIVFCRDVSQQKRTQEALVESEERFRAIAENASDLITEVDSNGTIVWVSPSCRRLLGREPEALIGRNLGRESTPKSMLSEDREALLSGFTGDGEEAHKPVEWRLKHADGSFRWFESRASTFWRRGSERGTVVIARDITDHVRGRQALEEVQERYRMIAQLTGDMLVELDAEGRALWISPTCEDVLGWKPDELTGTAPYTDTIHPDDAKQSAERYRRSIETGQPIVNSRVRGRHVDGSWRWLEIMGLPFTNAAGETRFLSLVRDITQRVEDEEQNRQLEQRMFQAQKLEGLGIMAGGVAHDFNNLLTPILGHASLALLDLPEESPVRDRLEGVQRAAHRAAALTQQMLTYTGTGSFIVGQVNLSELVKEIGVLIESAASGSVEIVYQLARVIPATDADTSQLSQVVMNLITNAVEAVGEGPGKVTIRTGSQSGSDATNHLMYGDLDPERGYVYFEVEDDGCGMDESTRQRIFDPFFSTKFTGRGLGLAAVLEIVRGHEGAIEIDSRPDRGTRFRILLPSTVTVVLDAVRSPLSEEKWRGHGLVLVVDDDEAVRDLAADALERSGFDVIDASDGREAVELFEKHQGDVRLVLLDRTMPGLGGSQALAAIRKLRPEARVVLMSGYSEEKAVPDPAREGLSGFVQKPFLPMNLLKKVREALGE